MRSSRAGRGLKCGQRALPISRPVTVYRTLGPRSRFSRSKVVRLFRSPNAGTGFKEGSRVGFGSGRGLRLEDQKTIHLTEVRD